MQTVGQDLEEGLAVAMRKDNRSSRAEAALRAIVIGTTATGQDFFTSLVKALAESLAARYAFVAELTDPITRKVRTYAVWADGKLSDNFEYDLAGTPCADVMDAQACFYRSGVASLFPQDALLTQMGVDSYLGMPLSASSGEVMGLLVVLHDAPIDETLEPETILEIFASRAAAELQRLRMEEALQESKRKLGEAQRLAHVGYWDRDLDTDYITFSDEVYRIVGMQPQECPMTMEQLHEQIHPEDRSLLEQAFDWALQTGSRYEQEVRIVRADGEVRIVYCLGDITCDETGRPRRSFGMIQDITERKRAEALQAGQNRVLSLIATGGSLQDSLTVLIQITEELSPGMVGSILLMDKDGKHLRHGVAPNLPEDYCNAIDGGRIGASVGSCGTAAHRGERVIVEDIASDPLWTSYRDLALRHGLRACWSQPIFSGGGQVLGTFAMYYREPHRPSDRDVQVIEQAAQLAGIAIERKQAEETLQDSLTQMRVLASHLQSVREEESARIAREAHDELGHALTGLKMDVAWLKRHLKHDRDAVSTLELLERVDSMNGLVEATIKTVRRIAQELRPAVLDTLGLVPALEWQAQDFQRRTGIRCQFISSHEQVNLDQERMIAVFRIFQESLTNVWRHAKATRVRARLEESDGVLTLTVQDNGIGIRETDLTASKTFGLLSMRERALLLGGRVQIAGVPKKGTTVTMHIPLHPPA